MGSTGLSARYLLGDAVDVAAAEQDLPRRNPNDAPLRKKTLHQPKNAVIERGIE
jgi:hypothetical protein